MPETMRAYCLTGPGKMEILQRPIPQPGPGQIRLKVAGAGLCHSDLSIARMDPPVFQLPVVMGHEASGWVDMIGPGVEGITVGDAYGVYFTWGCGTCDPCSHGAENVCDHAAVTPGFGGGLDGGMAEYILVDSSRHLVPLGDLDPIDAAPMMCAGITSYNTIRQALPVLGPGSSAVVLGVGGLGHLAVQILKAVSPAQVIAVDRHAEKLAQAGNLGADHGVLAGEGSAETVRQLTGGKGANLVIDLVGTSATMQFALSILSQQGQLKIVGVEGGTLPVTFMAMPREATISTPFAGTISDLRSVVHLAQQRLVRPEVHRITFDQLADTYAAMEAGKLHGRAVLVPHQA